MRDTDTGQHQHRYRRRRYGLKDEQPTKLSEKFSHVSPDVAVPHPDKKSVLMYVTSLFQVLPQSISMEAIEEVETLPRPASTTVMRVTTEQHYEIQTQQRFSQQVTHFLFLFSFFFRATVNENASLFLGREPASWVPPPREKRCGLL